MPCYLFTYHAYRSWMPDREEGYVRRHEGLLPQDMQRHTQYVRDATEEPALLTRHVQQVIIEEAIIAATHQRFRLHYIATEISHVHALVSWVDGRHWRILRNGIKQSFSRKLNSLLGKREWFSDGASRNRVQDEVHFDHLTHTYLADHRGLRWGETLGWIGLKDIVAEATPAAGLPPAREAVCSSHDV